MALALSILVLFAMSAHRPKQRKQVLFNGETFMMNSLYFASILRHQKERCLRGLVNFEKVHVQLSQMWIGEDLRFKVEMQFQSEFILRKSFEALNTNLRILMDSDGMNEGNITFDQMTRSNGELFLLAAIVSYGDSKGNCGVEWSTDNQTTIFCLWNPNQEPITKQAMVRSQIQRVDHIDYMFADQRFDDPEQDASFVDNDLLSRVRLNLEV